jgi:uncharacterized MAPEG superfamily protein
VSVELFTLVFLAGLSLVLPAIYGPARARQVGSAALMGNRDKLPEPQGAAGRGLRAHQNLIENLVPYGIVVLSAHALGISNGITVAAALVFLIARIVHAASYIGGVTVIRSMAYGIGVLATIVIMVQLF